MKITTILGSPRVKGNTANILRQFEKLIGNSHEATRINILDSDITIYASPVYVWDFSSQLKTLLDRQYCMKKWKKSNDTRFLMEGKQSVLLTTCGGNAENNADLIQEIFKRAMNYHHCKIIGNYVVPKCPSTLPSKMTNEYTITAQRMYNDIFKDQEQGGITRYLD